MSGGLYNLHRSNVDTTLDMTALKPYGDTINDGKVQLSFTLPVPNNERGQEAAKQLAKRMGLNNPSVVHAQTLDAAFTFYVMYGECTHTVNFEQIQVATVENDVMTMEQTDEFWIEPIADEQVK
jgi:beta-lysine 5,6-aminomutase beta subunit